MLVSVEHAVMRKKPEQRKEFSLFEMISEAGTQNFSAQNYGTPITEKSTREKMCVFSLSATGQSWMFGTTFAEKK